jgi:hypothetical protein
MTIIQIEAALTEGQKDIQAAREAGNTVLVEVLTDAWMMLFEMRQAAEAN